MGIVRSEKKIARNAFRDREQLIGCDVDYNGTIYRNLTEIREDNSASEIDTGRVVPHYIFTFENGDTFSVSDQYRRDRYAPDPNAQITFYFNDRVNEPEQLVKPQLIGGRKRKSRSNKRRSNKRRGSRRR